jgi:DNA-binding response OmpR family regulator
MERPLAGRSILVVEDEPLVALDVTQLLQKAGARVITARTLPDALEKADDPDLAAAVLDHGLKDTDTSQVCEKLKERGIPFVLYSGYNKIEGACSEGKLVHKPAHPHVLVATVVGVVQGPPIAH